MTTNIPFSCRRGTEDSARALAQERSKNYGRRVSVVQSPNREHAEVEPYVVEDGEGGIIRMWERLVAVYDNGKEIEL